ncbi:MAG: hypothetical protein P0116_10595 [Candidatus Nitrosocosmicus sp.]|nr:hypothetical protein [Candidatus Nitrosocosmicus sp.]
MNGIERIKGIVLILIAISFFAAYTYTLFATDLGILLLKLTVVVIVGVIFFIIGWIGVTLTVNEKNTNAKKDSLAK